MERSLTDLIARLPIPGLKESNNRHIIAKLLSEKLGIPVKPSQINLKDEILTVSVPPVVKSVIQMKQVELREVIEREGIKVNNFK